jgi:hypothetical protein
MNLNVDKASLTVVLPSHLPMSLDASDEVLDPFHTQDFREQLRWDGTIHLLHFTFSYLTDMVQEHAHLF